MCIDPLFSVVIPTYNRADQLPKTLDSLVAQVFQNFEVLIVDDGSTDSTENLVECYKSILNINYTKTENWGGPARPRNIGISKAKGSWICFLDADDSWYPEKLEVISKCLHMGDVIYHSLDCKDPNGTIQEKVLVARKVDNGTPYQDLLINGGKILLSGACVKASLLNRGFTFKERKEFISVEDYDLWLRLAKFGAKFYAIQQILGTYLHSCDGISRSVRHIDAAKLVFKEHSNVLNSSEKSKAKSRLFYWSGMKYWQDGKKQKALHDFKESFSAFSFSMSAKGLIRFLEIKFLNRKFESRIT